MRKLYSLLLLVVLMSLSFACLEDEGDPLDVFREIAYNSLTADEKGTVISDWKQAKVEAWIDGYYLVIFESTDAALGDVRVVVDPVAGRAVETLPRV